MGWQMTINPTSDLEVIRKHLHGGYRIEPCDVFVHGLTSRQYVPLAQRQYQSNEAAARRRTTATI